MSNTFEPGPIGEEAAKLLAAAGDWFHRTLGDPATARIATGAPECAWCPLCQLISVLRGDRPEITEKLAETQAAVAGLLRALADAAGAMNPHAAQHPNGSRVQKIDLGDERDDQSDGN
jgi:hypothetical protein